MKTVLHVGCGQKTIAQMPLGFQDAGWREVRFDINEKVKPMPDIVGTITDMTMVEDASMDALFSSHNIEHVFSHEVVPVLKEFRRVINDNGFVVVTCPDVYEVCKRMTEGDVKLTGPLYDSPAGPITPLDIIYGHIADIARGETYMAHKTGFDLDSLGAAFKAASFAYFYGIRIPIYCELWMIGFKTLTNKEKAKQMVRAYCGKPPQQPRDK